MKLLTPPIRDFKWNLITQLFGCGSRRYQQDLGIPAHNGIDIGEYRNGQFGYGTPILATHDFESVRFETDFPTKTRGTGIWLRTKLKDRLWINGVVAEYMETIYWHLADIYPKLKGGKAGDVIGLMGNTGYVFPAPSQSCPYCGTHLHFGLSFFDQWGNLIGSEYPNGYRDPVPYLFNEGDKLPIRFDRDLHGASFFRNASEGDDVSWLQTILKIEGFGNDFEPVGFFGKKTQRDVALLQKKYSIAPAEGYLGPKTRQFLNEKYSNR